MLCITISFAPPRRELLSLACIRKKGDIKNQLYCSVFYSVVVYDLKLGQTRYYTCRSFLFFTKSQLFLFCGGLLFEPRTNKVLHLQVFFCFSLKASYFYSVVGYVFFKLRTNKCNVLCTSTLFSSPSGLN